METYYTISDILLVDELVNDFTFAEYLYGEDFSHKDSATNVFWADMV